MIRKPDGGVRYDPLRGRAEGTEARRDKRGGTAGDSLPSPVVRGWEAFHYQET